MRLRGREGSLTKFARDTEKLREEDLKKLFDTQLSHVGQIGLFLMGALFGGLLTAAVGQGIKWVELYNLFTQPIEAGATIWVVAVGLVIATKIAFSVAGRFTLRSQLSLMKDYLTAREIVEGRIRK